MKTDLQIRDDVIDEISYQPFLNASTIGVSVKNGVVTLSGTVDSYSKKISAEKAAGRVKGVKAVAVDIEVKFAGIDRQSDTGIAQAILDTLKWHSAVKEDKIRVQVDDGWVTLEGEVEWEFQRSGPERAIEHINGVRGVTNRIRIIPKANESDIRKKIMTALHRSATVDAGNIHIQNVDGVVTLTGKVRSVAEKEDAATAAWFAPGVYQVDNRLEVNAGVLVD